MSNDLIEEKLNNIESFLKDNLKQNMDLRILIKSDYKKVVEFTEEGYEIKCPKVPQKIPKDQVIFLIKMMLSEIVELAETVTESPQEALNLVTNSLGTDLHTKITIFKNDKEIIAAQADALVDCYYYSLNVAAKHGIDLSKVFNVVHEANMNKRDPISQKFLRRECDNKILKPDGWISPNIVSTLFPEENV